MAVAGFLSSEETILATDSATTNGAASSNGDLGAAFAVAEVFLGTTALTGGLASTSSFSKASFAKETISFFSRRLPPVGTFGFANRFVGAFAVTLELAAFVPLFRARLTTTFFVFLADFAFKVVAPGLIRLRITRLDRGLAAAVFFGFFMATILANGARLQLQSTPGIWVVQRLFDSHIATDAHCRAQLIDTHIHPDFYLTIYE